MSQRNSALNNIISFPKRKRIKDHAQNVIISVIYDNRSSRDREKKIMRNF